MDTGVFFCTAGIKSKPKLLGDSYGDIKSTILTLSLSSYSLGCRGFKQLGVDSIADARARR